MKWAGSWALSLGLSFAACSPTDLRCDARDLTDDAQDEFPDLIVADASGALELDASATMVSERLQLRVTGLSPLGLTRMGKFDTRIVVSFRSEYLGDVPSGAEFPPMSYAVQVEDGLEDSRTSRLGESASIQIPIFGCGTGSELGTDETCCPPGATECELEFTVSAVRQDLLFPPTQTVYEASAHVELLSCEEESEVDVELILQGGA